jgi:quinoprotein glucose dehydrogenase
MDKLVFGFIKNIVSACHGADRKGTGNFPTLINVQERYHDTDIMSLLSTGRRMMPSFNYITKEEKEAIISYILDSKKDQLKDFIRSAQPQDAYRNVPYAMTGYNKFLSPKVILQLHHHGERSLLLI